MPAVLVNAEILARRVADQLEATAVVLRQQPLTSADLDRVSRQLQAEADLLVVIRNSFQKAGR